MKPLLIASTHILKNY